MICLQMKCFTMQKKKKKLCIYNDNLPQFRKLFKIEENIEILTFFTITSLKFNKTTLF